METNLKDLFDEYVDKFKDLSKSIAKDNTSLRIRQG